MKEERKCKLCKMNTLFSLDIEDPIDWGIYKYDVPVCQVCCGKYKNVNREVYKLLRDGK